MKAAAEAVRDWLMQSLAMDAMRFRIEARGESRPLVFPEGTIEQQQPNRRVEIRMRKPGPADKPEVRPARPIQEP